MSLLPISVRRILALGLPVLTLVVVLALAAQLQGGPPPLKIASSPPCDAAPQFRPVVQTGVTGVAQQGSGWRFSGEAWLEAEVCAAGTLHITASGELGGDELPQLTVAVNGEPVATPRFAAQEETVAVQIKQPGKVFLGYLNDYFLSDIRIATLRDLRLASAACQGFTVQPPPEGEGRWLSDTRTASLYTGAPLTIQPCAAGVLTFRAQGREGDGAFPQLRIQQVGKMIFSSGTTPNPKPIRLEVGAAPIQIAIVNPYSATVADRNLNVRRIKFMAGP